MDRAAGQRSGRHAVVRRQHTPPGRLGQSRAIDLPAGRLHHSHCAWTRSWWGAAFPIAGMGPKCRPHLVCAGLPACQPGRFTLLGAAQLQTVGVSALPSTRRTRPSRSPRDPIGLTTREQELAVLISDSFRAVTLSSSRLFTLVNESTPAAAPLCAGCRKHSTFPDKLVVPPKDSTISETGAKDPGYRIHPVRDRSYSSGATQRSSSCNERAE